MTHHQQYPADSATWLADSPTDGSHFMPKVVQRRAKRIIPDTEKDDKYWEKRKRNNMAAKRSRENKRKLEVDIRHKMSYLEEDNALLRKEIALIKAKFGIPPEQSLLTPEERAQCMQEVKAAQAAAEASARVHCGENGVYPVSLLSVPNSPLDEERKHGEHSDSDEHDRSMSEDGSRADSVHLPHSQSVYGPYNPPITWGTTAQHFQHNAYNDNQRCTGMTNGYSDKTNNNYHRYTPHSDAQFARNPYDYYAQYSSQGQTMYTNSNHLQGVSAPADLTTRTKRSEQEVLISGLASKHSGPEAAQAPNSLSPELSGHIHIDSSTLHAQLSRNQDMYSSNLGSMEPEAHLITKTEPGGMIGERPDLRRENVELKERLDSLTSQVEKMKSIVLKK